MIKGGFQPYNNYRADFRSERPFSRQEPPKPPGKPPVFAVVLECGGGGNGNGRRGLSVKDVEELIAGCPWQPKTSVVFPSGAVAGKLFFRQWTDAVEAVVYFWGRRLDGAHLMTAKVLSNVSVPSDRVEEASRLRDLFAGHARGLLSCEAVRRSELRIEEVSARIRNLSEAMRMPSRPELFYERQARRKWLVAERYQLRGKLEEFLAGMRCILAQLGELLEEEEEGRVEEDAGGVKLFAFEDELDLSWIHRLMVRECRRLDQALPIYACRRKILREINSNQV